MSGHALDVCEDFEILYGIYGEQEPLRRCTVSYRLQCPGQEWHQAVERHHLKVSCESCSSDRLQWAVEEYRALLHLSYHASCFEDHPRRHSHRSVFDYQSRLALVRRTEGHETWSTACSKARHHRSRLEGVVDGLCDVSRESGEAGRHSRMLRLACVQMWCRVAISIIKRLVVCGWIQVGAPRDSSGWQQWFRKMIKGRSCARGVEGFPVSCNMTSHPRTQNGPTGPGVRWLPNLLVDPQTTPRQTRLTRCAHLAYVFRSCNPNRLIQRYWSPTTATCGNTAVVAVYRT